MRKYAAEAENAAVLLADTLAGIILSGKEKAAHGAVLPSHHLFTVFLTTLTIRITKAENTISKPYTANISNIKRLLFMK